MTTEPITLKECRVCGATKPDYEFYRNRHAKDGRASVCKVCSLKRSHERYHRLKNTPGFYEEQRLKARLYHRARMWRERPWRTLV